MQRFQKNSMFYFYNALPRKAAVIGFDVKLKEPVDPELLKKACERAQKRHYYFRLTPLQDEKGMIGYKEHTAEAPVMPEDGRPICLGTKESNGYLFRLVYAGNTISLYFSHVLSDARGGKQFLDTVLYLYLTEQGYGIRPDRMILLPEDPVDPSEQADLYKEIPEDVVPQKPEEVRDLFLVPDEKTLLEADYFHEYTISFPSDAFMELCRQYRSTPVPVISVLINLAACDVYEVTKTIVTSVPVDMRSYLDKRALSNFTHAVSLPYEPALTGTSVEELMSRQAERLKEALQPDRILPSLCDTAQGMLGMPDIPMGSREVVLQIQKKRLAKNDAFTYLLTNIGRLGLPEGMEERVEDYTFAASAVASTPSFSLTTFGEKTVLSMAANFTSDAWIRSVERRLRQAGLDTSFSWDDHKVRDTVRTEMFGKEI